MNLVNPERPAHYYKATEQGIKPFYKMPAKKGGMRAPSIADARDMNLLVSISRIASLLPKPALTAWLQSQAIISALTLNRQREELVDYLNRFQNTSLMELGKMDIVSWCYNNPPGYSEELDVFARRVVEDMDAQSRAAMDFGTRMHAQIEFELLELLKLCNITCSADLEPFMVFVKQWIENNVSRVIGVEQIVGDIRLGIGGKLDLVCELNWPGSPIGIVDFKTQGVKNGKPNFYFDWFVQLAGYGYCVKEKEAYSTWPCLLSVVVDSKQPGPVHVKQWENPEQGWEVFLHCLEIFSFVNDYKPGKL